MSLYRFVAVVSAALGLAYGMQGAARAQQVTPAPVTDDAYQPGGVGAGAFIAYPSVETGLEITDNVFAANTGRVSDVGYFVAPELRVESDWARHQTRFEVSSRHLFFFGNPSEDETRVNVVLGTRLDLFSRTTVETEASYTLDQEGRGEVDVPGAAAEPPNEHSIATLGAIEHQFNRVTARAEGTFDYNLVEDVDLVGGGVQSNADRNYYEAGGELRLGYDISPRLQPFVAAGFSARRHEQEIDDNGFARDSDGYNARAGVRVEVSPLITGEASVGYEVREFEDAALSDIEGVTVDADLTWRPTPLTTVNFRASSGVEETATTGSSGALTYSFGIGVDHELRRHFLFGADFDYSVRDFEGIALSEETWAFAAGLTYQLNRQFAVRAGYSYTFFDSSIAGSDYEINSVHLGLLWQE